jgi:hypothetical protein
VVRRRQQQEQSILLHRIVPVCGASTLARVADEVVARARIEELVGDVDAALASRTRIAKY